MERWPTEIPLFCFVVLAALTIWALLVLSVFGALYAAFLGAFFFLSHVVFITYVRGSAVKLGPDQFPELYGRVLELSQRAGLASPPETYVQSAGGALNAFATKFFRSRLVVLYSDLLDACGDDLAARDMVIAHELGHHKSGHLRFNWILLPALVLPFLGSAYSRAREFTCDRFGKALCHDREGAVRGLTIVAAGKELGPSVDLDAFIGQQRDLGSSWMTLGRWLAFYPQLCERVDAFENNLTQAPTRSPSGVLGALAIIASVVLIPILLGVSFFAATAFLSERLGAAFEDLAALDDSTFVDSGDFEPPDPVAAAQQVQQHFSAFADLVGQRLAANQPLPTDSDELYAAWFESRQDTPPLDPFDGLEYGYNVATDLLDDVTLEDGVQAFVIWSSGPDGEAQTDDDLHRVIRFPSSE